MDKEKMLRKKRLKAEEEIKEEINDNDLTEILEKLKKTKKYKQELEDSDREVRNKLANLLYIMLPRKKDSIKQDLYGTKTGITLRDGHIYQYGKAKQRVNRAKISRLIKYKSEIIDLYREDEKRKLASELLNTATKYEEIAIPRYGGEGLIQIKTRLHRDKAPLEIHIKFEDGEKDREEIKIKANECIFFNNKLYDNIYLIEENKDSFIKKAENIIELLEEKKELRDRMLEKIEEKGKPYFVQEAL